MPSSLLFAALVTAWLAVLVPMAARRRQQMPRPSDAALAGRVLARPRRREQEVSTMETRRSDSGADPDDHEYDDGPPRYRPGRGGYDAEAAALAARARYVTRQRIVIGLVLLALATGLLAAGVGWVGGWYLHAAVDATFVGYLVYLRVQVREEQRIRARRTARMAGSRWADGFGPARLAEGYDDDGYDGEYDGDGYGYDSEYDGEYGTGYDRDHDGGDDERPDDEDRLDDDRDGEHHRGAEPRDDDRARAEAGEHRDGDAGTDGEPGTSDESKSDSRGRRRRSATATPDEPALPRLRPTAPPERPRGTVVLELDDEDPELHDLDSRQLPTYRRASGQ